MKRKYTDQLLEEAIFAYLNTKETLSNITLKYNISNYSLFNKLRERNILFRGIENTRHHIHSLNIDSLIKDSREKYYWLGFISADGNISKNYLALSIQLKASDDSQLKNFKEFMETDCIIKYITTNAGRESCKITLSDKKLCKYLGEYNIVPNKSRIFLIPIDKIPQEYIYDYLRGFYDGDGSISFTKKNQVTFSFCSGSYICINQVRMLLNLENNKIYKSNDTETWFISVTGNHKAKSIFDKLYEHSDSKTRLARKYNRYLSIQQDPM